MSERISRDEVLMQTAELWSKRSTCVKPNGAVLSKEGRIMSLGYNGAPTGQPHCDDVGCVEDALGGCVRTIHAESNAIAYSARWGHSTSMADLHCTTAPCFTCAKLITSAGITKVIYRTPYRLKDGIILLEKAGIEVIRLEGTEV